MFLTCNVRLVVSFQTAYCAQNTRSFRPNEWMDEINEFIKKNTERMQRVDELHT